MMSNDPSSTHPGLRGSRNPQSIESNENEYESSTWTNPIHVNIHPVRSPLNSIPDPSQLRLDLESDSDVSKLDRAEGREFFNDKTSISSSEGLMPVGKWAPVSGLGSATPKVISSRGKHDSEAISSQSTPVRSAGVRSLGVGNRICQSNGSRIGGSSRHSRRFTIVNTGHVEPVVDVPHFELEDDPLFWKDHNVQVLIRIRPLNNMERVLQGQARCLKQESAQTLAWLGHPETRFTFDHIVCETITQEKLFRVAGLPMVENCMSGYNSCIFAYGQTGSGKTFTMMGEIHEVKGMLNQDCGITPRIFEYLFTQIKAEEESRRDEKLTYSCRCSFLEIYNEQITDLLEPSSTNLQLREDFKKGVHVENLTECNVRTVNDVLQLLLKGAANRKIAATNMNSESSRSHSVFTCIIESRWEKDSLTHSRYGRLNLVDLAGSERQKSSGAEGDRLKEAANINKSLSTLGLVIMSLVDVAHGKHRHVPYRDSRLTFLLQDSLGGNSKTTIIANVSPSFCSATETLSTLKFAQRAKLIQNNAKVNEDASGDVTALQEQVQRLKDQLSQLLNQQGQPTTRLLIHGGNQTGAADFPHNSDPTAGGNTVYKQELRNATDKIKCLESALACSTRREKAAQNAIKKLEAELEHMRHLTGTMPARSDHGYDTSYDLAKGGTHHGDNDNQIDGTFIMQSTQISEESSDTRFLIEALERDNIRMMQDLQIMEERNQQLLDSLGRDDMQKTLSLCSNKPSMEVQVPNSQSRSLVRAAHEDPELLSLQAELEKMARDLEKARMLNVHYQEDEALKLHHQKDVELVHEQVEMETANTIIHLQSEIASLQVDLREKLHCMTVENNRLKNIIADKDGALRTSSAHWERATLELTSFLMDGSKSLNHASSRIRRSMACLFPHDNPGLGEHIESAAKVCMEKEEMILHLQKSLEDAQKTVFEMERKLNSLRGAAIAFTEAQHLISAGSIEELSDTSTNDAKTNNCRSDYLLINKVDEDPEATLSEVRRSSQGCSLGHDTEKLPRTANSTICSSQLISNTGVHLSDLTFGDSELLFDFNKRRRCFPFGSTDKPSYESSKGSKPIHQFPMVCHITEGLVEITARLRSIQASADKMVETYDVKWETSGVTSDSSSSFSEVSLEEIRLPSLSAAECILDQVCEHGSSPLLLDVEPQKISAPPDLPRKHKKLMLVEELEMASRAFSDLCVSLNAVMAHLDAAKEPERKRFVQNLDVVVNDNLCEYNSENREQRIPEMKRSYQSYCTGTRANLNLLRGNKIFALDGMLERSNSFFSKFEEACSTMQEADVMLNALVKSNQNAKQCTHMWKQVGKELKGERDCLLDRAQHLEFKLFLKESEDDILDDERSCLLEVTHSISLLVDCFADLQNHSEELFREVHCDVLSLSTYFHNYCGSLRTSFEQICSELLQKDFSTLVLHMCLTDYMNKIQNMWVERELTSVVIGARDASSIDSLRRDQGNRTTTLPMLEIEESIPQPDCLSNENLQLRKELARKEVVLEGLLFDFSLLQEAASNRKDIRDEINKLIMALGQAEHELQVKKQQLDDVMLHVGGVEDCLADTKHALSISNSKLEQTQRSLDILSSQKDELSLCLRNLHQQKSEVETQVVEKDEIIKGLEKEIIHLTSAVSGRDTLSMESFEDDLVGVTIERDQLCEEIKSLKERMELAYAVAEENEALALEARQDSEASKIYAEQKQEEVTILESSIEELENTVNVLEQKVTEMDEEVQKHQLDRASLETEVQAMRKRLITVESLKGNIDLEDPIDEKLGNSFTGQFENQYLDLDQAYARIRVLEKIRMGQAKEVDRMKEYVSELVLHAEAQASQYQEKYKTLEAMVCEMKKKSSSTVPFMPVLDKSERSSSRPRGSSSPFRCISNLVHQMHTEKDQELVTARDRIQELELLAASQQKEVCMLSSRLAAAESMTHDIIRDLLGLKLDMTNYADLMDQHQLHSLLDVAQRKIMESKGKDEEIRRLQAQVADLVNERDSCFMEINRREANNLAAQLTLEQLRERDQHLTVQNELLKVEKTNLMHRLVKLENMVRETERHKAQRHLERPLKIKDNHAMRDHSSLRRRTLLPGEPLSHVDNELAPNRTFEGCSSRHDQRRG